MVHEICTIRFPGSGRSRCTCNPSHAYQRKPCGLFIIRFRQSGFACRSVFAASGSNGTCFACFSGYYCRSSNTGDTTNQIGNKYGALLDRLIRSCQYTSHADISCCTSITIFSDIAGDTSQSSLPNTANIAC